MGLNLASSFYWRAWIYIWQLNFSKILILIKTKSIYLFNFFFFFYLRNILEETNSNSCLEDLYKIMKFQINGLLLNKKAKYGLLFPKIKFILEKQFGLRQLFLFFFPKLIMDFMFFPNVILQIVFLRYGIKIKIVKKYINF